MRQNREQEKTMCTEHEQRVIPPCLTPEGQQPRRRAATMQCNPAVAGLAVALGLVVMAAGEIHKHQTGIAQMLRGVAAGVLTLAVLVALHALARWVSAQDARPEPAIPLVLAETVRSRRPAHGKSNLADPRVQRLAGDPDGDWEDDAMTAMAADADALNDGQLDLVFSGRKLFELDGRDREDEDVI